MKNKGFTLVELISILVLISLIATITFRVVTKRIKNSQEKLYNVLIADLEKAAENYLLEHDDVDKYHINTLCISLEELQSKNYLDKDRIINPKTHEEMKGYIKVEYNIEKNQYKYEYADHCKEILVTPIIETILSKEKLKVVYDDDGLYETTDRYVYRGSNPNNYIKLNGVMWRIVDIDKTTNMVKIINLKDNQIQWPTNGLKEYLNTDFDQGTTYESFKQLINDNSKWNNGKIEKLDTAVSIKSVEKQSSDYNTVGLLTVGEYIDASLEKDCYEENNCSSYLSTGKKYWLLNTVDDSKEWYVDGTSIKNITVPTTEMYNVYPVINLKINTSVTGEGTEVDPYMPK